MASTPIFSFTLEFWFQTQIFESKFRILSTTPEFSVQRQNFQSNVSFLSSTSKFWFKILNSLTQNFEVNLRTLTTNYKHSCVLALDFDLKFRILRSYSECWVSFQNFELNLRFLSCTSNFPVYLWIFLSLIFVGKLKILSSNSTS